MTAPLLLLALVAAAIALLFFLTSRLACLSLVTLGLYFYLDTTLLPVPASVPVSRGVDSAEAPLQAEGQEPGVVVEEKSPRPAARRPFWVENNRPFWQEKNLDRPQWDWRVPHLQRPVSPPRPASPPGFAFLPRPVVSLPRTVFPRLASPTPKVHAVAPSSPPAREEVALASRNGTCAQRPPFVVAPVLAVVTTPPKTTGCLDVRAEAPQGEALPPCSYPAVRAGKQKGSGVAPSTLARRARSFKPVRRTFAAKKVHFDAEMVGARASSHLQPLHQAVEGATALAGPVLYQQSVMEVAEDMAGVEYTTVILNTVAEQNPPLPIILQATEFPVTEQCEEMVDVEATVAPVFPALEQTSSKAPEMLVCGSTTPSITYTQEVTPVYEPVETPSPAAAPPAAHQPVEEPVPETTTAVPAASLDAQLLGLVADADDDSSDDEDDDSSAPAPAVSTSSVVANADDDSSAPALAVSSSSVVVVADADDDSLTTAKKIRDLITSVCTQMGPICKGRSTHVAEKPTKALYTRVWKQLQKIEDDECIPSMCISYMDDIISFIEKEPGQWNELMQEDADGEYKHGEQVYDDMCELLKYTRLLYGEDHFDGEHPVPWISELRNRCTVVGMKLRDYAPNER